MPTLNDYEKNILGKLSQLPDHTIADMAARKNQEQDHCLTCRFFHGPIPDDVEWDVEEGKPRDIEHYYGFCHKNAPSVSLDYFTVPDSEDGDVDKTLDIAPFLWPMVTASGWCGEHQP